jgi:hypothetical protein
MFLQGGQRGGRATEQPLARLQAALTLKSAGGTGACEEMAILGDALLSLAVARASHRVDVLRLSHNLMHGSIFWGMQKLMKRPSLKAAGEGKITEARQVCYAAPKVSYCVKMHACTCTAVRVQCRPCTGGPDPQLG